MQDDIKSKIQEHLPDKIKDISLKGSGSVNHAYFIETESGDKYTVKIEKEIKDFHPQNTLIVEAKVAQILSPLNLSVPTPEVIFISTNPEMYGYRYIEGEPLINIWKNLSNEEKSGVCKTLGYFHAEIGQKISKEGAKEIGVVINESTGLHPEVLEDYSMIIEDEDVPKEIKSLAMHAKDIFDTTISGVIFQFLHNDAQHENILISDKEPNCFIDFGESEYGEVTKEFSRYIRDFPKHFKYIVSGYEERSGHKLSYARLVTNSFISGLIDNVENYKKGKEDRVKAEKSIRAYREMIESL